MRQDIKEDHVLMFIGRGGNQVFIEEKNSSEYRSFEPRGSRTVKCLGFFFYFNRGKTTNTESMDRPVGEKRYEPISQVTTPPPAPSVQYTQPQSINSPVLSLPAHHKPALSEGEQLESHPVSCVYHCHLSGAHVVASASLCWELCCSQLKPGIIISENSFLL